MRWKAIGWFYAAACVLSGSLALAYRLAFGELKGVGAGIMAALFMFGPAVAAWRVSRRIDGRAGLRERLAIRFRPNRWWLVAWLVPLPAVLLITGVSLLLPWLSLDLEMTQLFEKLAAALPPEELAKARAQVNLVPVHPFFLVLVQGLIAGVTINALAAFGEELGWRGFLFREVLPLGFWRASLLTGLLWGPWHAPLTLQGHNYPQHPVVGVAMMTLFTVLLSPFMHLVRLRSGSVVAAAVAHGSINGLFGAPIMIIKGGDDLTMGATGAPGLIVLLVLNVVLFVVLRRRPEWAEAHEPEPAATAHVAAKA